MNTHYDYLNFKGSTEESLSYITYNVNKLNKSDLIIRKNYLDFSLTILTQEINIVNNALRKIEKQKVF